METCPGCGREFGSPMAVMGHQRACPGRASGGTRSAPPRTPQPAAAPEASPGNALSEMLEVRKLTLEIEDLRDRREREARQELERKAAEDRALAGQRVKEAEEQEAARRRRRVEEDERRARERQERAAAAAPAQQRDREQREQLVAQRARDAWRDIAKAFGTEDRLPQALEAFGLAAPPADVEAGAARPAALEDPDEDLGDEDVDEAVEILEQLDEAAAGDDVDEDEDD